MIRIRPLLGAIFLVAGLVISTPAFACSTAPTGSHYYGIALWQNAPQNNGAYTDMYVSSGSAADASSGGFIEQTLWEGTDNQPSSGTYWVEAGYTYGWGNQNILSYYWADNRPTYGYYQHQVTSVTPSVGSWMPVEIQYLGSNAWGVYLNFSKVGTSTYNPPYSENMSTGSEATSSSSTLAGAYSSGLEYKTLNGSWTSSWGSGAGLVCYTPANVSWVTTYKEIKDWQN
jgi:hypothetical protein